MSQSVDASPIGPILQAILKMLWKKLFEPGNELYLPGIIKNGSKPLGLPSYDPAHSSGTSKPFSIGGVPKDVADSACTRNVPISPIAVKAPQLSLSNAKFTGLSLMSPVSLSFSSTEQVFTAVVSVGTGSKSDEAFVLTAWDSEKPNYHFSIACCEPIAIGSDKCSSTNWTSDASGHFTATVYDVLLTIAVQLNTPADKAPNINVLSIEVGVEPKKLNLDFDVQGLPKWAQQMAQIAIQQGVGNGSLVDAIATFINSPPVIGDIEKMINEQLAKIPSDHD